jgi:hypothetical protein
MICIAAQSIETLTQAVLNGRMHCTCGTGSEQMVTAFTNKSFISSRFASSTTAAQSEKWKQINMDARYKYLDRGS